MDIWSCHSSGNYCWLAAENYCPSGCSCHPISGSNSPSEQSCCTSQWETKAHYGVAVRRDYTIRGFPSIHNSTRQNKACAADRFLPTAKWSCLQGHIDLFNVFFVFSLSAGSWKLKRSNTSLWHSPTKPHVEGISPQRLEPDPNYLFPSPFPQPPHKIVAPSLEVTHFKVSIHTVLSSGFTWAIPSTISQRE